MSLLIANTNGQSAPGLVQTTAVGAVNLRAAHTIAFRVRFTSTSTTQDVVPIAFTADADLSGSWIERRNGDASTAFFGKRWNTGQTLNDQAAVNGYGTTTDWKHYALTYDATNIRVYLNGVLINTTASATTRTSTTTNCRIFIAFGGQYVMADAAFIGRALTADELLMLTAQRLGPVLSKGDVFGFYPLFKDTFRQDWSGRGNDLDDFAGTGTPPAANNEDPGVAWWLTRRTILPVVAAASNIAATGTTQVTGTAAMSIERAQTASGTTNVTGTADLRSGLNAAGSTLVTGTASMTALAQLTAAGQTQCNGTASMTLTGNLGASGNTQCFGTADLTGTGPGPGGTTVRIRQWRRGPRYGR